MKDCIFCKIINKLEPALIILENEHIMCLLPIKMEVPGHTIIIPKKHFKNIFDVDELYLHEVTKWIKDISLLLQKTLGADGVNILNANGEHAWQSVAHLHFHIMPRFKNDNLDLWPNINVQNIDRQNIYKKIIGNQQRI